MFSGLQVATSPGQRSSVLLFHRLFRWLGLGIDAPQSPPLITTPSDLLVSHRTARAEQWASQLPLVDSVSAHREMTYCTSDHSHALGFVLIPFFFLPFTFFSCSEKDHRKKQPLVDHNKSWHTSTQHGLHQSYDLGWSLWVFLLD